MLKLGNSSLLGPVRMDNLLKAHTRAGLLDCKIVRGGRRLAGKEGKGGCAIQFATLTNHAVLTASDFAAI